MNNITSPGMSRLYVQGIADDANYLDYHGRAFIICSGICAGFIHQIILGDGGYCAYRRNVTQGDLVFDYNTPLYRIDNKIAHPVFRQFYRVNISNGAIYFASGDGAGIVLEIPAFCKYIEFSVTESTYGQYGACTADATLPTIQTDGEGREKYKVYTAPGTYHYNINGEYVRYFFITLNSGTLNNIKLVTY